MKQLLLLGVCLIAAVAAGAQDFRVGSSTGTAEIELPGSGWLQAVSGRAVPPGSQLSTWLDSGATVVADGLEITLGELTAARFQSLRAPVTVRLLAGIILVETDAVPVELAFRGVTVRSRNALFRVGDAEVVVLSGEVELQRESGTTELLIAPAGASFAVSDAAPLFPY